MSPDWKGPDRPRAARSVRCEPSARAAPREFPLSSGTSSQNRSAVPRRRTDVSAGSLSRSSPDTSGPARRPPGFHLTPATLQAFLPTAGWAKHLEPATVSAGPAPAPTDSAPTPADSAPSLVDSAPVLAGHTQEFTVGEEALPFPWTRELRSYKWWSASRP